jgi:anti-anti-sigma regulatory factor
MHRVEIDPAAHLLTISWAGHVDSEESRRCCEEIRKHMADIQPGGRVLTDLSGLEFVDQECAVHIDRIMDLFHRRGVDTVTRIIPNPYKDVGFNIMSLFHYHYRHGVQIMTCKSMEEARRILQT